MSHETNTRTRLGFVRRYPVDLAAVSVGAAVAYALITSLEGAAALRLVGTLPLTLFLPGYALVSVLFPASERETRETASAADAVYPGGIDGTERVGVAFALSLAITPIVVMVLAVTDWGLTGRSIAAALAISTVVLAQLGVVRRLRTSEPERFTVSAFAPVRRLRTEGGFVATMSSVLLVAAIGAAVSALLVGFLVPPSAGGYTELGLYTETEDGELVAGNLTDEVAPGESVPITIGIENEEGERVDYTVVVQQQTLEDGEVVERTELRRLEAGIDDGSMGTGERTVTPTAAPGETVRISVLLYQDEPPAEPTNENAAEDTYFWVTVTGDGDA